MTITRTSLAVPRRDAIELVASPIYWIPGRYRVRLFEHSGRYVLLVTDLGADNPGASVTNAVTEIAAHAIRRLDLRDLPVTVVEHYDYRGTQRRTRGDEQELFAEATGSSSGSGWLFGRFTPSWQALSRADVEALIGGELP